MRALLEKRVLPLVTARNDELSVRARTVCERQGIAVRGRADECELGVVGRPGGSGVAPGEERSRRPTAHRHENLLSCGIAVETEPYLRTVAIEPKASQEVPGRQQGGSVGREVREGSGTKLTDPDVELPQPVADESHKPAVRRDFGLLFRALPVR